MSAFDKTNSSGIINILKRTTAGTFSAICTIAIGHPADTIRIRLQVCPQEFKSTTDCVIRTVRHEKLKGLFKGIGSSLCSAFPSVTVSFLGYSLMHHVEEEWGISGNLKQCIAGAFGGMLSSFVKVPAELMKNRAQVDTTRYIGVKQMARKVYLEGGIISFYKGLGATILRDVPAFAVYFGAFFWLKQMFNNHNNLQRRKVTNIYAIMMAGGLAGIASWLVVYPIDVAKNIIQCYTGKEKQRVGKILLALRRQYGFRALYRGFGLTLIRAFPLAAFHLYLYDQCLQFLKCNF